MCQGTSNYTAMNLLTIIYLVTAVVSVVIHANVIITRYEDQTCNLDPKLVAEIESYKNNIKVITEEIRDGHGQIMYTQ